MWLGVCTCVNESDGPPNSQVRRQDRRMERGRAVADAGRNGSVMPRTYNTVDTEVPA